MTHKTIKTNINIIRLSILVIILIFTSFVPLSLSQKNNTIYLLNQICSDVEKINYNLGLLCTNSFDTETLSNNSVISINSLNDSLNDLKSINTLNSKESELKESLNNTILENIKLIELCNNILNEKSIEKIIQYFNDYKITLKNVQDNFNILKDNGLDITFTNISSLFYSQMLDYTNTLIKLSRDQDILFETNCSYNAKLKETLDILDSISENLETVIVDIYENDRPLDTLQLDVLQKKACIFKLKTNLSMYSIPSNYTNSYNKLTEVVNSYIIYICSFETALNNHISSKNNFDMSDIYLNYQDSLDKYTTYIVELNEYKEMNYFIDN